MENDFVLHHNLP